MHLDEGWVRLSTGALVDSRLREGPGHHLSAPGEPCAKQGGLCLLLVLEAQLSGVAGGRQRRGSCEG